MIDQKNAIRVTADREAIDCGVIEFEPGVKTQVMPVGYFQVLVDDDRGVAILATGMPGQVGLYVDHTADELEQLLIAIAQAIVRLRQ